MPNVVVKNLAEQTGRPLPVVEAIWRKAKRFVANEGKKGNYLRVLEVTKRMMGVTTSMKKASVGDRVRWKTMNGEFLTGTVEGSLPDCCMIRISDPEKAPSLEALLRQKQGIMVVPLLDVELL